MKTAITLTTIHKPVVLKVLAENIRNFGHTDVAFVIVGDKKTPVGVGPYCHSLEQEYSIPFHYFDCDFQVKYLKRFPDLDKHIPFNSFARRNIGDLYVFEEGFSTVIRIDDDNFPTGDDFIGFHSVVGREQEMQVVTAKDGWFNICEQLVDHENIPCYPRGFPYSQRWKKTAVSVETRTIRPALNAGLWLGDPDVDAITRLTKPINAVSFKETLGQQFALNSGTWSPINTQNTSYDRRLIPAAFVSPFVGRYDDIWSGYVLRKIMDHLGDTVSYGRPLLKQDRNQHNLWKDLELEMNGNLYTDHLLQCLNEITLSGQDYAACYYELAEKLAGKISENREVFLQLTTGMRIWSEIFQR